ncbi:transducin-like enhancer protein 6 isoform X2 [Mustela nigripes]|uniref:transducin-like enhancer protein 6 isoform X2 n=1 Tax=Mustela nigripes TaxID=77151 RepID=UPI002814C7AC|nr:transducin-like enhancer protein 6 isoform X2 [Mustela nigripes]
MTSLEPTTSWGSQRHQSLTKEQRSPWAPCLKMTSWGHPSPQKHPPGMMGPPGTLAPSELSCQAVLDQLRQEFPRFPPHLAAQVESVNLTLQKIRQGLQEHHKQMESFLRTVETWSQALGFQPVEASPEASLHPEAETPQPSRLQGPPFEDVLAPRSSDWLRQPSRAGTGPPMPDTQSPWDPEPRFWQDVLTEQLWQIFTGTHKRDQRRRIPVTERLPGLESQDAGPQDSGLEPRSGDALGEVPSPAAASMKAERAGAVGADTAPHDPGPTQAPAGRAYRFLKPICWDPEDFEDTWKRPDALPWQSQKAAIPRRAEKMRTLKHGEPVLATAVSSCTRHAFTCGRGGVKVWSLVGRGLEDRHPESYLRVQTPQAYLCTCLLSPTSTTLLTGGHNLAGVSVWDLTAPSLRVSGELPCAGLTCQALASGPEATLAFAGFTDGTVRVWDLRDQSIVRDLPGPPNGTKSIAVKDQNIWTGGLDTCLRCWDLRTPGEPLEYQFESQIMSLSPSPHEDWVLVGTASGQQWLQPARGGQKHMVGCKNSTILGLKFSPSGQWWVSVGTDDLVSIYGMPGGIVVFQVPETSSILCCDVSPNNRLVVTGSEDHASVYQITY